jgi:hypothetical protein
MAKVYLSIERGDENCKNSVREMFQKEHIYVDYVTK